MFCENSLKITVYYLQYSMKFITTIIKKFIKDDKNILGRWNIDYCDKKLKRKIDLANEDHCGPCGTYMLDKLKDISKNEKDNSK